MFQKMCENIKKCKEILNFLAINNNPRVEKFLIKNCEPEVIEAITNIATNAWNGKINYSPETKDELQNYKKIIYSLTKEPSVDKQRKIIQKGGAFFLPLLLPAAIFTALSLATELLRK